MTYDMILDNKQASLNPKQHVDRLYVKFLNVTIRRNVTIQHLVTQIFIYITNKLCDRNKKIADSSYTTGRLVLQQETKVSQPKIQTIIKNM